MGERHACDHPALRRRQPDRWPHRDGSATYGYDARTRLTIRSTTLYIYNGDGMLVDDGTTQYTQDLASSLSQVLQTTQGISTTSYLYGLDRLASVAGSTCTWYGTDTLGSVRLTLDDAGMPLGVVSYNPWRQIEAGSATPFGFTGELQQDDLVYLRARWYDSRKGTFPSFRWRTDESNDFNPYSHHPYAYALGNPVLFTDPSGKCIDERVPIFGEPGCRIEEGVLKGKLDYIGAAKVVVTGAGVAATVVGCAATALVGCAATGAGAAAVTSWGNQALDNVGQPVGQAITNINWGAVARDASIAAVSAGGGGIAGKGVGAVCRAGPWCATAIGAAIGSTSSGTYRVLGNLLDGNPDTEATDGVLGACVFGGLTGGIVGRLTIRLPVGPGVWEPVNESMSLRAAAYQQQITGRTGQVYRVNGVKFDGYQNGTLIDAKGPGYATFVRNGRFQTWFRGQNSLLEQAERQILAANGTPIR